jgi:hypothetical protein
MMKHQSPQEQMISVSLMRLSAAWGNSEVAVVQDARMSLLICS